MEISALYNCFKECTGVTTDTRQCQPGTMFIALKGESFNGNQFAAQALQEGCRYAVVDEDKYADANEPRILKVDNCLKALQQLANYHRRQLGTYIIGITGTNGKTTTKELVANVLKSHYNVLYTQGNFNNHIGVPLTLLGLKKEHDYAVVEMGANHPGEINTLVHIAEPDCGLITNVGMAHLEGFGSLEGVIRTKGELYDYLRESGKKLTFIDADNNYLTGISEGLDLIAYGEKNTAHSSVVGELGACKPYLTFNWKLGEDSYAVNTHLIGSYNLKNALAAITVGTYFKVPVDKINRALSDYLPKNNRSQLLETETNHLIVDAYNANPTSMKAALDNFHVMDVKNKMVILGDMKELGASSREEHRKVVSCLDEYRFDLVMLVGAEFRSVDEKYQHFENVDALTAYLEQHRPMDSYILVKGSNSMKLDKVIKVL